MLRDTIFAIGLAVFFPVNLYAELPKNIKSLNHKYRFDQESYSFAIQNLSDKAKPIISHNAETLFNTASLVKIYSTFIALKDLGPNYKWRSEFS